MSALTFCKGKELTLVQTLRITKRKARPSSYIQACLQKIIETEASYVAS